VLYMIVERFKNGDPVPVYRRFRDQGRRLPPGLTYVSSWVTTDLTTCYQLMECEERPLLDQWIAAGSDLVGGGPADRAAAVAPPVARGRPVPTAVSASGSAARG
jgi:hypothetical protein